MKHRNKHLLLSGASLIWTAFIWSNSLKNAEKSGEMSGNFLDFVNGIAAEIFPSTILTEHFIRKAAHFTEFAILGALLTLSLLALPPKHKLRAAYTAAPIALLVAVNDELIQLFSDGRSAEISDVILDFSGALTGIFIVYLVVYLIRAKSRKRS